MDEMILDSMHITNGVLTRYKNHTSTLKIPPFVTSIASGAFGPYGEEEDIVHIEQLIIGKNVKSIGENAFYKARIDNVQVSEENPYFVVSDGILYNKELTRLILVSSEFIQWPGQVRIVEGVEYIPDYAFYYTEQICSLTLPDSVKSIGEKAFASCENINYLNIGKGLSSIKEDAFNVNNDLTEITLDPLNTSYKLINGVLYDKDLTSIVLIVKDDVKGTLKIPDTVKDVPPDAFCRCCNLENVIVGKGLKTIKANTFSSCNNLETLELGNSIVEIDFYAFSDTAISSINFPDSLKTVSPFAFEDCKRLKNVSLNNSDITFDEKFHHNELSCDAIETINLGRDYKSLANWPFDCCYNYKSINVSSDNPYFKNDESRDGCLYNKEGTELLKCPPSIEDGYTIPSTVEKIADGALLNCKNLTSIHIPKNISYIGYNNFVCCSALESITVDKDNPYFTSTQNKSLYDKDLTKLIMYIGDKEETTVDNLPDSLSVISSYAFSTSPHIKNIILPSNVKRIEELAFAYCTSLENVKLNKGLLYIGKNAFLKCNHISVIDVPSTVIENEDEKDESGKPLEYIYKGLNNFTYDKKKFDIYKGKGEAYLGDDTYVSIPDGVHTISSSFFYYFSLENEVFEQRNNIKGIFLPKTVKNIESGHTFYKYEPFIAEFKNHPYPSLERIDIDKNNPYFSSVDGIVYNKEKTRLICAPKEVKNIYSLPSSLKVIEKYAFKDCSHIVDIELPPSVEVIEDKAFDSCKNLRHIKLNEGLKKIGKDAFLGCKKLVSIDIPNSVEEIEDTTCKLNGKNSFTYNSDDFVIYEGKLVWYKGKSEDVVIPEGVHTIALHAFTPLNRFDYFDDEDDNNEDEYHDNEYDEYDDYVDLLDTNYPEIKSIYLPSSVEKIEFVEIDENKDDFADPLTNLEKIEISKDNSHYSSLEGVVYNKDETYLLYVPRSFTGILNIKDGVKILSSSNPNCKNRYSFASLYISSSVEYINLDFLYESKGLEFITVDKDNKNYSSFDGILYDKKQEELLYVPHLLKGDIKIPSCVKKFPDFAFESTYELTSLEFLNKDIIIEDRLFNRYEGDKNFISTIQLKIATSVYPSQLSDNTKRNIVGSVIPHLYEEDKKGSRYQKLWLSYIKEERKSLYNEILSSKSFVCGIIKEKFLDLEDVMALIHLYQENQDNQDIEITSSLLEYEHSNFTEEEITNFTMNDMNKDL